MSPDDSQLLRDYAKSHDEGAFAAIIRRHLDLVYSVALRQVNGDTHLAEDVAQTVFADLAAKAGALAHQRTLAGWLFVSARFAAAKAVRGAQRRRAREQEAMLMEINETGAGDEVWARLRPVLDDALAQLRPDDREAILLRFFEGHGFAAVGERLRLDENTARMRVDRALDKLHALLARRGFTSTTVALATVMTNQAVTAAPAGLGMSIAATAIAGASSVGTASVFMGITKAQVALFTTVLATGAGGWTLQHRENVRLAAEIAALRSAAADSEAVRQETNPAGAVGDTQALRRVGDADLERLNEEATALRARLAAEATAANTARSSTSTRPAVIYDVSQLDLVPRPKFRSPPQYPDLERKQGLEGKALVEFVLNAGGTVTDVHAVEATNEAFAASAVAALKKWQFEPGQKGGVPVGVRMRQPITFSMSKEPAVTPTWWF